MNGFQPWSRAEASVTAAHRAAPQWAKLRHAERASVLMPLGSRAHGRHVNPWHVGYFSAL